MNIFKLFKNTKESIKDGRQKCHYDATKFVWRHRHEYKDKFEMQVAYSKKFHELMLQRGVK